MFTSIYLMFINFIFKKKVCFIGVSFSIFLEGIKKSQLFQLRVIYICLYLFIK